MWITVENYYINTDDIVAMRLAEKGKKFLSTMEDGTEYDSEYKRDMLTIYLRGGGTCYVSQNCRNHYNNLVRAV